MTDRRAEWERLLEAIRRGVVSHSQAMDSLARLTSSFQALNTRMSMALSTGPAPGPGAHGFSEKGEFDFTVGSLHGLRVWNLEPAGKLKGNYGAVWEDGENVAVCPKAEEMKGLILALATEKAFLHWCHDQKISPQDPRIHRVSEAGEMKGFPEGTRWIEINDGFMPLQHVERKRTLLGMYYQKADYTRVRERLKHPDNPHEVPGPNGECGCGFWAYWTPQYAGSVFAPSRPVIGLVEGYGKTRIGDKGFRAAKAKIIALCVMFDWENDGDGQLRSMTELRIGHRYPSAKIYDTLDCLLAMHPPTTDYLPQAETRTVAEVRVPQLMCPMGIPLGTIERNMPTVAVHSLGGHPLTTIPAASKPELKAWHADGSDCEHLPRFIASGGNVMIVHKTGHVSIEYTKNGQALSPGIGNTQVTRGGNGRSAGLMGGGGGGSASSWTAPANVTAVGSGWRPVVSSAKFDQALSKALTHHPNGQPRLTGGSAKIQKFD